MRAFAFTLGLLISLPAFASEWERRLEDFNARTAAERRKLGLDKLTYEQQRERFPTPEVHFSGAPEGTAVVLCPGEAKQVVVEGTLPAGSVVIPTTDDVQVTQEKTTAGHWSGTLTARKGSGPHLFSLRAALALANQTTDLGGLLIGCRTTLTLTVEGATLTIKADVRADTQAVTGEWKKGGKVLGTTAYDLSLNGDGFRLSARDNEEELQRRGAIVVAAMQSPRSAALNEKQEKVLQKLQACSTGDVGKMMACLAGPQAEAEKLNAEREKYSAEVEIQAAPLFGCDELTVALPDSSSARGCAGHRPGDDVELKYAWTSP